MPISRAMGLDGNIPLVRELLRDQPRAAPQGV